MLHHIVAFGAVALAAAFPGALRAQDSWRLIETFDEFTALHRDTRLILRSLDFPAGRPRASLVVACGDRLPSDARRTMLLYTGEPVLPFGDGQAAVEIRFAGESQAVRRYFPIHQPSETIGTDRPIVLLGEDRTPAFSAPLLRRMVSSDTLELGFRVYGDQQRTVRFALDGLRAALAKLEGCEWPVR